MLKIEVANFNDASRLLRSSIAALKTTPQLMALVYGQKHELQTRASKGMMKFIGWKKGEENFCNKNSQLQVKKDLC